MKKFSRLVVLLRRIPIQLREINPVPSLLNLLDLFLQSCRKNLPVLRHKLATRSESLPIPARTLHFNLLAASCVGTRRILVALRSALVIAVFSWLRAFLFANFVGFHAFVLVARTDAFVTAWEGFVASQAAGEGILIAGDCLALLVFAEAESVEGILLEISIKLAKIRLTLS